MRDSMKVCWIERLTAFRSLPTAVARLCHKDIRGHADRRKSPYECLFCSFHDHVMVDLSFVISSDSIDTQLILLD